MNMDDETYIYIVFNILLNIYTIEKVSNIVIWIIFIMILFDYQSLFSPTFHDECFSLNWYYYVHSQSFEYLHSFKKILNILCTTPHVCLWCWNLHSPFFYFDIFVYPSFLIYKYMFASFSFFQIKAVEVTLLKI